ncbi:GerAB/ArcD/ProY family transporter [Gorillibacterium massiliense]|uniref:GerAB/ArcD/ProY family transporter n=1 Tax=Gorillibacterium massiliense TaxID=1280390 RepID=UPI0004B701D5|nr:GerAB/ArcD/ProY family transporter [Gorillibacterium massiliense]
MEKIYPSQTYMLFSQYLISTIVSFFNTPIVEYAGYSAWLAILIGSGASLVLTLILMRYSKRRPDEYLGQYGKEVVGKYVHYPLVLFVALACLFFAADIFRQLTEFIIEIYLPETPLWAGSVLLGIGIARLSHAGFQTIFRSAQGIFFVTIFMIVPIALLTRVSIVPASYSALITNLQGKEILPGSFLAFSLFSDVSLLVWFMPLFVDYKRTKKAIFWAIATAAFNSIVNMILVVLLLGPKLASDFAYPNLEMIRFIRTNTFLANLDPILIILWLFTLFIKIALYIRIGNLLFCQILNLKDSKPLNLMLAVTTVFISYWLFENVNDIDTYFKKAGMVHGLFTVSLPLLYPLVEMIRNLIGNKQKQPKPKQPGPLDSKPPGDGMVPSG